MGQRLQWLFASILIPMVLLGIDTLFADAANMVVQVRKTGGGALNGAQVCVGLRNNPCPNGPRSTRGNGIAVIKTGDGPHTVLVTVSHSDYKSQQRVVNFKPGQPSVRFILEPKNTPVEQDPLSGSLTSISINAMDINGRTTHTNRPRLRVGWHTNRFFHSYQLSLTPDFSNVPVVSVSPGRKTGTAYITIPSPIPGRVYTVYLRVGIGQSYTSNVVKSASITFGRPRRGSTTKTFKLAGARQIDAFLRAAQDKGYKFNSGATSPQTTCRTRTFRYLRAQSHSALLNAKVTCRYEYFQKGGPTLASGWRLKSVLFRKRCFDPKQPCPLNKFSVVGPKNTADPYFMVLHKPPMPGGRLELIQLIFTGPASATTVTQALR